MESILFFILAALAIFSALLVILHKKPIYSALSLILCFLSIAGLFFLLHSEFLAIMQIIIYAGAIMVFILFVIMLLDLKGEKSVGGFKFQSAVGLILSFLLLFLLITGSAHMALNGSKMSGSEIESSFGGVRLFGELLFNDYLLSFEVASVLLLIAMIGAVVFGKKKP